MIYARINSDGGIDIAPKIKNNPKLLQTILNDGFLPLKTEERPSDDNLSFIESYKLSFRNEGDKIVRYYDEIVIDQQKVEKRISELKSQLTDSDYKVVKNQELQMTDQPLAYDPEELHGEREALRESIRELELYIE